MWFVVRKRSKHKTPHPCPVICHNVACCTSQCALIVQKYVQAVGFRIPEVMVKILYRWSPAQSHEYYRHDALVA